MALNFCLNPFDIYSIIFKDRNCINYMRQILWRTLRQNLMKFFSSLCILRFMETTKNKHSEDFRLYLQAELIRRCQANPQYSLRSFAKALKVSSSALSAMINGKRTITERTKKAFGLILGLGLDEIHRFTRKNAKETNYNQVTIDSFALISDWYHYAILELLKIDSFESNPSWIAKRLGITKSEANIAIERLIRMELIEVDAQNNWKDTSGGSTTNIENGLTSVGSRKLQEQVLQKAITALQTVDISKRDNTSMTVAINTKDMLAAKEMIKEFRRNLTDFLERTGNETPNDVYHLGVAFYPITNNEEV